MITGAMARLHRAYTRAPMPERDHNPANRRLHLPIVGVTNGPGVNAVGARSHRGSRSSSRPAPPTRSCKATHARTIVCTPCAKRRCVRTSASAGRTAKRPSSSSARVHAAVRLLRRADRASPIRSTTASPSGSPRRCATMGLRYVVLTGVARDDLADGGAAIWAAAIRACRAAVPGCGVEVLPSDFKGGEHDIATVLDAEPDVFAHNLETGPRLHDRIRPAFGYDRSLEVLRFAKRHRSGPGHEVEPDPGDGRATRGGGRRACATSPTPACDILTMGQYLQPTPIHLPVDRWVTPEEFAAHKAGGRGHRHRPRRGRTARALELPRRPQLRRALDAAAWRRRLTAPSATVRGAEEPACKPDPVRGREPRRRPSLSAGPERPPAARSPGRCGLPGSSDGPPSNAPCSALLRTGVAEPRRSPAALVGSYPTVSPLPPALPREAVCFLLPLREVAPAWLSPASCPAESGLSSNSHRLAARGRPAGSSGSTVLLSGRGRPATGRPRGSRGDRHPRCAPSARARRSLGRTPRPAPVSGGAAVGGERSSPGRRR